MTLNEKELKLFKKWLKGHLAFGPVTVTFTKKDGTERVMECTTSPSLVPVDLTEEKVHNTDMPKKERKVNEDVCPVYDLGSKHWKSFRWDSIKQIRLEIK
jgi:hypothetical protein